MGRWLDFHNIHGTLLAILLPKIRNTAGDRVVLGREYMVGADCSNGH